MNFHGIDFLLDTTRTGRDLLLKSEELGRSDS